MTLTNVPPPSWKRPRVIRLLLALVMVTPGGAGVVEAVDHHVCRRRSAFTRPVNTAMPRVAARSTMGAVGRALGADGDRAVLAVGGDQAVAGHGRGQGAAERGAVRRRRPCACRAGACRPPTAGGWPVSALPPSPCRRSLRAAAAGRSALPPPVAPPLPPPVAAAPPVAPPLPPVPPVAPPVLPPDPPRPAVAPVLPPPRPAPPVPPGLVSGEEPPPQPRQAISSVNVTSGARRRSSRGSMAVPCTTGPGVVAPPTGG